MNYQEQYDRLVRKEEQPGNISVAELFDMASVLAVAGNYAAKKQIYEEFIWNHPQVGQDEKLRVQVYQFDQMRRGKPGVPGDPVGARNGLLALNMDSAGDVAMSEFDHAMAQTYFMEGNVAQALEWIKKIPALSDFPTFPVDQQLYYLEGAIAMKIKIGMIDDEFNDFLAQFQVLSTLSTVVGVKKERVIGVLVRFFGEIAQVQKKYKKAASYFFVAFLQAPDLRSKAVLSTLYLSCRYQFSAQGEVFETMRQYFKDHKSDMLDPDIASIKDAYDFVDHKLFEEHLDKQERAYLI